MVYDPEKTKISFEDLKEKYLKSGKEKYSREEVREALYNQLYQDVHMYHLLKWDNWQFDTEISHTYQVDVSKAVKDTIIQTGQTEFTLHEI